MDDFWNECDDEVTGSFESGGFTLLPDNTKVLFNIDEVQWKEAGEFSDNDVIEIVWEVNKPDEFAGTKLFQKIKVKDSDSKKALKAKKMLAAIDHNAGGKIKKSGKFPTNEIMQKCLVGKVMGGNVSVWDMDGKQGNWVSAVMPKQDYVPSEIKKKEDDPFDFSDDDDIPL